MMNFNLKTSVFSMIVSLGVFTSCEQQEQITTIEEKVSFENNIAFKGVCNTNDWDIVDAITGTDYNSSISTKIDDRSCSHDYEQSNYGSSFNWGGYRLKSDDNDNPGTLQVRMERTSRRQDYGNGKFLHLTGTVRILNVGSVDDNRRDDALNDADGTYIAQVKGRHDKIRQDGNFNESSDPAIVLFIAKPRRENNGTGPIIVDSAGRPKDFKIYAEQVRRRGGSGDGPTGRRLVYITTVKRNRNFDVDIRTNFVNEPNNTRRQYVNYTINGVSKEIKVSTLNTAGEKTNPEETRIRMGAYRCRGGDAHILWRDNLKVTRN